MPKAKHSFKILIKDVDTKDGKETIAKGKITIKLDDNINIINSDIYSITLSDYEDGIIKAIEKLYNPSYTTVSKIE